MKKRLIFVSCMVIFLIIFVIVLVFLKFPMKNLDLVDDNIVMTIKNGTLTNTSATVIITNNTDKKFLTGKGYSINKNINGKWYKIKLKEEMIVTANAIEISKDNPYEENINWQRYFGKLEKGKYRIVKNIFCNDNPRIDKSIVVEFDIK